MTLPSSGTLTINNIVGEFGGSAPHGLSEYYRNGGLVTPQNTTVPTSGTISISDFYGTVAQTTTTLTSSTAINGQSNRKQITASSFVTAGNILRIPSGFWVWSDDVAVPALIIDISCEIQNEGKIIGKGGYGSFGSPAGAGQDGGDAIKINSGVSGVVITNASGAFIAGGGGGGGGSGTNGTINNGFGGGGAGGGDPELSNPKPPSNRASGGVLNAVGEDGAAGGGGTGGGAGGGGGGYAGDANGLRSGGGGGRILPGTGGTTGGGSAGNAGANSSNNNLGGGGGGWGAAGGNGTAGNGGAGGKAIEDTGNTYTLSNSGTIYGATT